MLRRPAPGPSAVAEHMRRERPVANADQHLASHSPPSAHRVGMPAPRSFTDLYEDSYRDLLGTVIRIGATLEEAEDAVAEALAEVLHRWPDLREPLAYARTAAMSNFIKARTRGLDRTRARMLERGAASPSTAEDPELAAAENAEWVHQLLAVLPPAEKAVMALTVDGYRPIEIADMLGKTQPAVRRNLHDGRHRLIRYLQQHDGQRQPDQGATTLAREAR
jgi:RNA polymerase sigma factor (sigma-70 family)